MAMELLTLTFFISRLSVVGNPLTIQGETAVIIFVPARILSVMHNEFTDQQSKVSGHRLEQGSPPRRNEPNLRQLGLANDQNLIKLSSTLQFSF